MREDGGWWDGAEWYDWLAGRVDTADGGGDGYYESALEAILVARSCRVRLVRRL